jgi:transposase-like protein
LSAIEVSHGLFDDGDYRQEHLRAQELSGLSVAEYCRLHDVRPATFYGWRRLVREGGRARAGSGMVSFTEVVRVGPPGLAGPARSPGAAWAAEVALPSGALVRVGPGADARLLRAVFEALG